jgi:hypothetical protein
MMTMTIEQSRVWERSSSFRAMVREAKKTKETVWQAGMDLLNSIKGEEKNKLEAIWAAPDADETATAEENYFDLKEAQSDKQDKLALPVGLELPADEIANPEQAAKILGVSAENI